MLHHLRTILLRTAVFAVSSFARFFLFIGIGLLYCLAVDIPCLHTVPGSLRDLVFRVIPATGAGHALALVLLWARRGPQGILTTKQSAWAALVCAVILDGAYLSDTSVSGIVLRRSVQLMCAFVITLGFGWRGAAAATPVASDGAPR